MSRKRPARDTADLLAHLREQHRVACLDIDDGVFRAASIERSILHLELGVPVPATPDEAEPIPGYSA